ncbi:hypothetical protein LEMLEM_LOCUS2957 [Lemmus lemmus]
MCWATSTGPISRRPWPLSCTDI